MVEDKTQEDILKLFGSGNDAVKAYEEVFEGLKDKSVEEASVKVSTWWHIDQLIYKKI